MKEFFFLNPRLFTYDSSFDPLSSTINMEKSDNNGNNNGSGGDDFVFSPDAVGRWADSAPGASPAADGGSEMPGLEPIDMEVVEEELERAERGEEVSDAGISRIVEGDSRDRSGLSAYEKKEEKREEKRKVREEEENKDFQTGSVNLTDRVKNKSSQTEMTKVATMRKEDVRNMAKRSGRNPDLEGPFEGASEKFGTEILQWEDVQKAKRRDLARAMEGKFKKKRVSGDAKRRRNEQLERQAREDVMERRRKEERQRKEERERKEREEDRREDSGRGQGRDLSPIRRFPRMNLEKTILARGPPTGRRPPSRQFVTSTVRPGWNWHGNRRPGTDAGRS